MDTGSMQMLKDKLQVRNGRAACTNHIRVMTVLLCQCDTEYASYYSGVFIHGCNVFPTLSWSLLVSWSSVNIADRSQELNEGEGGERAPAHRSTTRTDAMLEDIILS